MLDKAFEWFFENPGKGYAFGFVLLIAFALSSWVIKSHMEARSFTRITGEQVSTWDAMWVQLRVDRPIVDSVR